MAPEHATATRTPELVPVVLTERRRRLSRGKLAEIRWSRGEQETAVGQHVQSRARTYKIALACGDVLAAAVALTLALTTLGQDILKPTAIAAVPLLVLVGKICGLYERDELLLSKRTLDEAPILFELATLYTLIVWLAGPLLFEGVLGREQGIALWLLLFASMVVGRKGARAVARRITPVERCALIGSHDDCTRLHEKIDANPSIAAEVVVSVAIAQGRAGRRETDTAEAGWPLEDVLSLARDHQLDRLIVAPAEGDAGEMAGLMRTARSIGLHVSVLPRMFQVVGSHVEFDELDGMTVLGVKRLELSRSSQIVKRVLDLVVAAVGWIVLSPLLLAIAIAIKLDSPGPVFFRQLRVGRDGRCFRIFKFRSMVCDAELLKAGLRDRNETEGLFKMVEDPRVTRVGRFLRRTALDEMPQLLNVLFGEMSLVGPRPLVADEDELIQGWDRRRLHLTPGMTGHWQILGSGRIPLREMVKIDYLYVTGWSLWGDMKILLRTVPHVVGRRGV